MYISPTNSARVASRPLWLWPNLLSLDAPLIAVLWLHLFAVSGRVKLSPAVTLILALAVWIIYVADRLFDVLRATPAALTTARHRFYRKHRKTLLPVAFVVLGLTGYACTSLDRRTLIFGSALGVLVAGYFVVVHRFCRKGIRFPKQAVAAVVFGAGTFLPVLVHLHAYMLGLLSGFALFIAVCWLNIVLIEHAEWNASGDRVADMPPLSTIFGGQHALTFGIAIAALSALLMTMPLLPARHAVLLAISLSALLLAGLAYNRRRLSVQSIRVLADVALLTPAIVLLFLSR